MKGLTRLDRQQSPQIKDQLALCCLAAFRSQMSELSIFRAFLDLGQASLRMRLCDMPIEEMCDVDRGSGVSIARSCRHK
jgi:hypothetical protein